MQPVIDPFISNHQVSIPGLPLLFQSERLADLLLQRLPETARKPRRLTMNPSYLRFKPDSSCLVAYQCHADDRRFVCYAKAFGRANVGKLDKARQRPTVDGPLGPGMIVIAEHGLVIWFFPNDPALRSLRRYVSGDPTIRALAYKPERRFVGLIDADTANPTVLKIYKQSAFDNARHRAEIADRLAIFPDLDGVDGKRHSLRLRWLAGQTLTETVQQQTHIAATHHCGVAAALLAELHNRPPPATLPVRSRSSEQQQIASLAAGLVSLCPHLSERINGIADRLDAGLGLQVTPPVMIHGDFYANQVLLTADGARLLDFDELAVGTRESDIGLFISHLHLDVMRGRLSDSQCESLAATFIDSYARHANADGFLIELYTLVGLFQLSHRPFRDLMERWQARIAMWLEKIQARLDRLLPQADTSQRQRHGDQRLPSPEHELQSALDRSDGLALVAQALTAQIPGISEMRVHRARLLRHKPGRRALIRYDLEARGDSFRLRALGKIRTKGLDTQTFATNQRLFDAVGNSPPLRPLQVPRPLAMVPALNMWLQEWVDGRDGWQALDGADGTQSATLIGEALHRLHSIALPTDRSHTWRDELDILEKRLSMAMDIVVEQRERIAALLTDCVALAKLLEGRPTCGIHRDFYPDQVLLRDGSVYMLDMDLYCTGDPGVDIGNFIAHVQERDLRRHGDPHTHREFYDAFANAYFARSDDRQLTFASEIYRVLTLARHVHLSTQFEDRRPFTTDILCYCESEIQALLRDLSPQRQLRENQ